MKSQKTEFDYLVIGGGFYGCCLALYLRSISDKVLLVDTADELMSRASKVNQARIHTGFHYPRSALTAVKSMVLHKRFQEDFAQAVVDNFQMLYAIPKRRSKISSNRFFRMFRDIGAPIQQASSRETALFDENNIDSVFICDEFAFDYSALENMLVEKLVLAAVDVRLSSGVDKIAETEKGVIACLFDGSEVTSRYAFNVTYSNVNSVLDRANLPRAALKHELTELALITPPPELEKLGVTIMDGPFFSCMPYPATDFHSLSHVKYTPHSSWIEERKTGEISRDLLAKKFPDTRVVHMIKDGKRFLPCIANVNYERSLFEIKTVLIKNEHDDGRPILYQQKPSKSKIISILGGKIDNIYDLFDLVTQTSPEFSGGNLDHLLS